MKIIKQWEHRGWGDSLNIDELGAGKFSGHMSPKPEVGDLIWVKFESGKAGELVVTNVKHIDNPRDMFFLDADGVRYLEAHELEQEETYKRTRFPSR